jgi:hypothetical protein
MLRAIRFPPYLVLLRVGFTLPPALPPERCALTAPFHPYRCAEQTLGRVQRLFREALANLERRERGSSGGIFSVALAVCTP